MNEVYSKLLDCQKQLFSEGKMVSANAIKARFLGEDENHKTLRDIIKYHNTNMVDVLKFGSTKVSALRGFATTNNIEVLVINIDSFAKDENIINKSNDKLNGQNPVEFIQATHPIVIVDEPQNMETEKRIAAIDNLKDLCTLRYSATHRNQYNLTYSLNPVKCVILFYFA